jgi:Domain of unknown function (DUF397)
MSRPKCLLITCSVHRLFLLEENEKEESIVKETVRRKSSASIANGQCVEAAAWRTSSFSFANGNCAEIAGWRKASDSVNNGQCLEAGSAISEPVIGIRDTQEASHPYRITLEVPAGAWARFTHSIKEGFQP